MSKTLCPLLLSQFHDEGCATCLNDPAVIFFYNHAGWSYYKSGGEAPEDGHWRSARMLAAAEAWGKEVGLEFTWYDDWSLGMSHRQFYGEGGAYEEGEPTSCEVCIAELDGELLASLGCIDDADADYRRVIEAELADEALDAVLTALERQYKALLTELA